MKHLIFDIETLAQNSNSVVLSIACLSFEFTNPVIDKTTGLYLKLNVEDQVKNYHREIDKNTVDWWKKQSEEARAVLKPSSNDLTVREACVELNKYIAGIKEYEYKNSYVFSRGHYFDFPILDSMYNSVEIKPAFNGWKIRDVRTLLETVEMFTTVAGIKVDLTDIGTNNHNALDDCVADVKRITRLITSF